MRRVTAYVEKVFRGKRYPDTLIMGASYKADYRLIPKDEEAKYLGIKEVEKVEKIFPKRMPFPPLMREIILREAKAEGRELKEEPTVEIKYRTGVYNQIKIAKEGETPNVEFAIDLGKPASPTLYKGINLDKRL